MASGWAPKNSPTLKADVSRYAAARRDALVKKLPDDVLVIPSGSIKMRTFAEEYPYRVGSDFYWLTGLSLPDAYVVISGENATIFMHDSLNKTTSGSYTDTSNGEFWVGPRPSVEEISSMLSIECKPIGELDANLQNVDKTRIRVRRGLDNKHVELGTDETLDRQLASEIAKLRLIKDAFEVQSMREAITVTHIAIDACLREIPHACTLQNGERWIEGTFFRTARTLANGLAYASIVAAGPHATILHWQTNDGVVRDGDLLLMDVGAESNSLYAADITRTFPVSGTFRGAQREVYELVLEAQLAGINAARPGAAFRAPHEAAVTVLSNGLVELGVLRSNDSKDLKFGHHRRFMPHGTSHPLGLDVHDCLSADGLEGGFGALAPGNVITMEPGLYFQPDDLLVPEALLGIGIRIEDDVLITEDGCEVLSAAIPKTVDDVETWVQQARSTFTV